MKRNDWQVLLAVVIVIGAFLMLIAFAGHAPTIEGGGP